jgi:hypothetical protein
MKHILMLSAILSPFILIGQKNNTEWSQEIKIKKGSTQVRIILSDKTGIYCLMDFINRNEETKQRLVKFDTAFNEIYNEVLAEESDKHDYLSTTVFNNEVYVFLYDFPKKNAESGIYTFRINKETGKPFSKPKKFFTKEYLKGEDYRVLSVKNSEGYFDLSTVSSIYKEGTSSSIHYYFDSSFNIVGTMKAYIDNNNRQNSFIGRYFINDEKSVLFDKNAIATGEWNDNRIQIYNDSAYYFVQVNSKEQPVTPKIYLPKTKEKIYSCRSLKVNENEIAFTGVYTTGKQSKGEGVYYIRYIIDSNKIGSIAYMPFAEISWKGGNKIGKLLPDGYRINFTEINKFNNSITIGLEDIQSMSSLTRVSGSSNYTNTYNEYRYGNIVMLNLNKSGAVQWGTIIPKNQVEVFGNSGSGGYGSQFSSSFFTSYAAIQDSKNIYVLFNDNTENTGFKLEPEELNFRKYKKEGAFFMVKIDMENGSIRKEMASEYLDNQIMLTSFKYIDGGNLFFPTLNPRSQFTKSIFKVFKISVY